MATPPLHRSDLKQVKKVLQELYTTVPTGVGTKSCITASDRDLNRIMTEGARWTVEEGYGTERDLLWCEEQGHIEGADISHVSQKARKRGRPQCGTLGSGNHFLEIQCVEEIFDPEAAQAFGIEAGQICIMITAGRGGAGASDLHRPPEDAGGCIKEISHSSCRQTARMCASDQPRRRGISFGNGMRCKLCMGQPPDDHASDT